MNWRSADPSCAFPTDKSVGWGYVPPTDITHDLNRGIPVGWRGLTTEGQPYVNPRLPCRRTGGSGTPVQQHGLCALQ